ncbi:phosphoadenosine phosphosulfate reductase family protein [Agrobacterium tumefaciens]|uniref:phosphoadenosine phosphosulfate reductase domain-containing protein n=1 Tax=Agrobacterium tumefaciens TaxID=358 RepID=UPI001572BE3F|nr:phosphoadenosine phosphosulfate reductase family protein [Agrobacterium tumefaciens]
MLAALSRHERIALQVSGGRDSIACLFLLREHLERVTVYWVNTGDAFPETLEVIRQVRELAPHFIEVQGRQPEVIAQFGMPTDLLPQSCTPIGVAAGKSAVLMQDTMSCCARVMMVPMQQQMVADGITLIIRGQKACDTNRAPFSSGYVENGIEYLFPIEGWSVAEVDAYLADVGAPVSPVYEQLHSMPDCMTCSGWWSDKRAQYLAQHHPEKSAEYQRRLGVICTETAAHINQFNHEFFGE